MLWHFLNFIISNFFPYTVDNCTFALQDKCRMNFKKKMSDNSWEFVLVRFDQFSTLKSCLKLIQPDISTSRACGTGAPLPLKLLTKKARTDFVFLFLIPIFPFHGPPPKLFGLSVVPCVIMIAIRFTLNRCIFWYFHA